ncbi:hypothetical protein VB715_18495 [Crocosphaera sp. UHCC 0190]|uniref:hypothetical protein n=1 Tax=Crocosphaera sp. UHCC 0190 TaxID=3110246 RepID=UPI002B220DE4|nr:hypothetical protein [Crocosphaera sp. UHCC 0190]MEA5511765.1 hypothetical protein [Crocosphaera sp. UHCC 0190]
MAKFGAIYLSFNQQENAIEKVEKISSILVEQGYSFTVRYHDESPWIQLYVEDPEKVVEYAEDVSKIFPKKRVIGLAAYTVSDEVSFCEFKNGTVIRLLQSGFNNERRWDLIEGVAQVWESEILKNLTMEISKPGMVSSHVNKIGVFLNLPGFGIPRPGEAWSQEIIN